MEYYSALKKELNSDTAPWMNLKDIVLTKINQTQKDKYYMTQLTLNTSNSQIHKDRK